MSNVEDVLKDFAKSDDFVSLQDGEEFEGILVGAESETILEDRGKFDKAGQKKLHLRFECSDGKIREFTSKSRKFGTHLLKVKPEPGDLCRLTRFGETATDTTYLLKILSKGDSATPEVTTSEETTKKEKVEEIPF